MVRQSFVYDEQSGLVIPRSSDDSYREKVQHERMEEKARQDELDRLNHPGLYL